MDITHIESGPAPLVLVAIPISDENVHQPRGQEGAGIDPVARIALEVLEQLFRPRQLDRAGETHVVVGGLGGALLDHSEQEAWSDTVEPSQPRVRRGQLRKLRFGVEDARRPEQRGDHERGAGMRGADLVLNHVLGERRTQLRGQGERGILVNGPEHVLTAVGAQEPEYLGLATPAAAGRCQPAGEA